MITRGIIEEIVNRYTVKVRMPIFNGASFQNVRTKTEDLNDAKLCVAANYDPNIHIGDCVFVAFEDNNYGKPVVIGYLYKETRDQSFGDAQLHSLIVNTQTHLSYDTTIGEITPEDIEKLRGVNSNIQSQINVLKSENDNLKNEVKSLWEAIAKLTIKE